MTVCLARPVFQVGRLSLRLKLIRLMGLPPPPPAAGRRRVSSVEGFGEGFRKGCEGLDGDWRGWGRTGRSVSGGELIFGGGGGGLRGGGDEGLLGTRESSSRRSSSCCLRASSRASSRLRALSVLSQFLIPLFLSASSTSLLKSSGACTCWM